MVIDRCFVSEVPLSIGTWLNSLFGEVVIIWRECSSVHILICDVRLDLRMEGFRLTL